MDLRRYELATLAAARRLRSSYCCLAHGSVLAQKFGEPVREIALDHRAAGLDEVDVAVMDLAERVVEVLLLEDARRARRPSRRELRGARPRGPGGARRRTPDRRSLSPRAAVEQLSRLVRPEDRAREADA